ncbi:MAG: polysaccharide deacetylase family protein [Burkholderiaceae bacterium]
MRFRELSHELMALLRCYPAFVTQRVADLEPAEIPVFVFHTIEPMDFEEQMDFLVANGYRTLSLAAYLDTLAGRRKPGKREVLLTFDDARSSFWLFAFPLLRKAGLEATLFAITGWTPETNARPNLDDAWAGRVAANDLAALDPDDRGVCSWDELRTMHSSGTVSVDSHSHLHRRVFAGRKLLSLIRAEDDFSASNAVLGPYLSCRESPLALRSDDFVGLPLLSVRGFFEDGPAVRVPMAAMREFQALARAALARGSGRLGPAELAGLRNRLPESALESVSSERSEVEMREDLALARASLREKLGDPAAGRTLCVPFTLGGETVIRVARELGIEAMFWGVSSRQRISRPGSDPLRLVRLKNDFLWRLPGKGRKSLGSIYAGKVSRRLAGERPY